MRKIFFVLSLLSFQSLWAQTELTFDQKVNTILAPTVDTIFGVIMYPIPLGDERSIPFILLWLVTGALIFTFYFKFINVRRFGLSLQIVRGVFSNPNDKGEISHFQALATALSGTVGLGNIAGVALAITTGGPGATFWMILAGILGMSSKFLECTLGVKYRIINEDGSVSGGPMYYLNQGFSEKGLKTIGLILAAMFAILCIGGSFGGGNMFQINQATKQIINITGGEASFFAHARWIIGAVMAFIVFIVIVGGIKGIAKVTDKVVPFMCGLYVLMAFIVIFSNLSEVPHSIGLIFSGAFNPKAIAGGMLGVLIIGFQRAAFSNEAGMGSASIAHSAVKTDHPVTEGLVSLLEPFIDTVVICTMTALVVIITGQYETGEAAGVTITSHSFETVIPGAKYFLAIAVILFAFSTMISWSYYGLKAWTYLFGNSKASDITYKLIFCTFIIIGSSMELGKVMDFSDAMILAMSFPNFIGLILLAPKVKEELQSYLEGIKNGTIKRYK